MNQDEPAPAPAFPDVSRATIRYDTTRSYRWNYDNAPAWPQVYRSDSSSIGELCGVPVGSPLGVAAGPLLNGRWLAYFAALGFDVLTYKTVRSRAWPCYALPNLQPVETESLLRLPPEPLNATEVMTGNWAVSFGMPSQPPDVWRRDIEETRRRLPREKRMAVSVVATPDQGWGLDDVADDYARCAAWAVDSGADFVELNFSCPNVSTCDGQLFQAPQAAAQVVARARQRVGDTPLLVKIGHVPDTKVAAQLVRQLSPYANALVMINCIPARVERHGQPLFSGQPRGIAGPAIHQAVRDQVTRFVNAIRAQQSSLEVVAVGGIRDAVGVEACLACGAAAAQVASAIMWPSRLGFAPLD